ncbi:MAG: hypothetical protein QOJ23_5520 [Actinomycetota bacterium]|jgi:hypothetical protein|nr:hypothetical protein [Actinomycetota bacterium]
MRLCRSTRLRRRSAQSDRARLTNRRSRTAMTSRPAAAPVIARVRPPPSCPCRGRAVTPGTTAPMVSRGVRHQGATSEPMTTEPTPVGLIRRNPATPEVRTNIPPPPATTARPAVPGSGTTPSAAVPATIRAPLESAFVSAAFRTAGPQPGGRAASRAGDPAAAAEPGLPQADPVAPARVRRADPQAAADLRGVARAAPAAHSAAAAAAVPAAATATGPAAARGPAPAEPEVRPVQAQAGHRASALRPRVRARAEMGWAVPTAFPLLPGARSTHRESRWCRAGGSEPRRPHGERLEGQRCRQLSVLPLDLSPAPVERSARRPCWRSI